MEVNMEEQLSLETTQEEQRELTSFEIAQIGDYEGHYDPHALLAIKDLDKKEPAIHICTTNRSGGKTTGFLIEQLKNYHIKKKKGEGGGQGFLIYRELSELCGCHGIYEDVLSLYPDLGKEMTSVPVSKGKFYQLILDNEPFGYAFALKANDKVKKFSPLFRDLDFGIMDEYQSEDGAYLKGEFTKMQSLIVTIARGGGKIARHVNVYLLGNPVTLLNPYYLGFGIPKRLRDNTHFLRGHGWVAEFDTIDEATQAIQETAVYRAFNDNSPSTYMAYSTENKYLKDAETFVQKPTGRSKYMCTIIFDNEKFGVREFFQEGYLYITEKIEPSCNMVLAFKANDHTENTIMVNRFSATYKAIKESYLSGLLRFDSLKSKNVIFDILAIDIYE
jgi:hypothetical protein